MYAPVLEGVLKKFASKTKRRIFLEPRKPLSSPKSKFDLSLYVEVR
jgi:hypothetical protein